MEGRVLFDWIRGNVEDDHAVNALLNSCGRVSFCELHQHLSAHRMTHQRHSLLWPIQLIFAQILQQIVSEFGDCVGGCVGTVSVVACIDEERVAVLGDSLRPGDTPEVLTRAHESVVHH